MPVDERHTERVHGAVSVCQRARDLQNTDVGVVEDDRPAQREPADAIVIGDLHRSATLLQWRACRSSLMGKNTVAASLSPARGIGFPSGSSSTTTSRAAAP